MFNELHIYIGLHAEFCETTKSNIHDNASFTESTKMGDHEKKWFHGTQHKETQVDLSC